jgi:hypothetical protein
MLTPIKINVTMQHEVICMKLFIKPFEQEVFGKQTLVTFPYPREDMYSDSIFPYLVFDGGAFFFLNDKRARFRPVDDPFGTGKIV